MTAKRTDHNERTALAKAAAAKAVEDRQAKRDFAMRRIELAHDEVPAAYAHRNTLIIEDSKAGIPDNQIGPLYGLTPMQIGRIINGDSGPELDIEGESHTSPGRARSWSDDPA